jgi:hypothetical protein
MVVIWWLSSGIAADTAVAPIARFVHNWLREQREPQRCARWVLIQVIATWAGADPGGARGR